MFAHCHPDKRYEYHAIIVTIEQMIEPKQTQPPSLRFYIILVMMGCVILIGALLFAVQWRKSAQTIAPDFDFISFEGDYHRLSDFKGQIIVLNFWASWCVPCRAEAPELQAAWEHYQTQNAEVAFIGMAVDDNLQNAQAFVREQGLTFLNGLDLDDALKRAYIINAIPRTFIIDQDGIVRTYFVSALTMDDLIHEIDALQP